MPRCSSRFWGSSPCDCKPTIRLQADAANFHNDSKQFTAENNAARQCQSRMFRLRLWHRWHWSHWRQVAIPSGQCCRRLVAAPRVFQSITAKIDPTLCATLVYNAQWGNHLPPPSTWSCDRRQPIEHAIVVHVCATYPTSMAMTIATKWTMLMSDHVIGVVVQMNCGGSPRHFAFRFCCDWKWCCCCCNWSSSLSLTWWRWRWSSWWWLVSRAAVLFFPLGCRWRECGGHFLLNFSSPSVVNRTWSICTCSDHEVILNYCKAVLLSIVSHLKIAWHIALIPKFTMRRRGGKQTLCRSLVALPPILAIIAMVLRQLVGNILLNAHLPPWVEDDNQSNDIVSTIFVTVKKVLALAFIARGPNCATLAWIAF